MRPKWWDRSKARQRPIYSIVKAKIRTKSWSWNSLLSWMGTEYLCCSPGWVGQDLLLSNASVRERKAVGHPASILLFLSVSEYVKIQQFPQEALLVTRKSSTVQQVCGYCIPHIQIPLTYSATGSSHWLLGTSFIIQDEISLVEGLDLFLSPASYIFLSMLFSLPSPSCLSGTLPSNSHSYFIIVLWKCLYNSYDTVILDSC